MKEPRVAFIREGTRIWFLFFHHQFCFDFKAPFVLFGYDGFGRWLGFWRWRVGYAGKHNWAEWEKKWGQP